MNPSEAHTKIASAAIHARTAIEEIEIGNLLDAYNYAAHARNSLAEAMSVLSCIVAELPDKPTIAIEL